MTAEFSTPGEGNPPASLQPVLRALLPRDAPAMMALRQRAIRECPWNFGTPPAVEFAKSVGHYRRQLVYDRLHRRSAHLGLWRDRDLVGMAGIRTRLEGGRPFGLIYSMYIDPEWRGRGYGRALLFSARKRVRNLWNLETCRMCVETGNHTALRLYQSCGFDILRHERDAFRIAEVSHDVYHLEWVDAPASEPASAHSA